MATHPGLKNIKHKILVLSGKGGVGKSTVATQFALCLVSAGYKVGLLDIDLCGPSVPTILGLGAKDVHSGSEGWVPVYPDAQKNLAVMSIAFLVDDKNSAIVWRGPKKSMVIKQFLEDVCWGELDYLVIDTPPGTSDEHISVCEYLKENNPDGAIIVTTPQNVALIDVKKEISFCQKIGLPILGVIENMSGFKCPHCSECSNIFSTGGGEALAKQLDLNFIGRIPLDPQLMACCESGNSFIEYCANSDSLSALKGYVKTLKEKDMINK